MTRENSPAYAALRASSRRLLLFIEGEIARQGGGAVTIHPDQFAAVASIKIVLPGLAELNALGLLDVKRHPKRHVCALSERWRNIENAMHAMRVSADARARGSLPIMMPQFPAISRGSARWPSDNTDKRTGPDNERRAGCCHCRRCRKSAEFGVLTTTRSLAERWSVIGAIMVLAPRIMRGELDKLPKKWVLPRDCGAERKAGEAGAAHNR